MKIHHREMLLHASALLHQTGDILTELVRTADEDRDVHSSYAPKTPDPFDDLLNGYFPDAVLETEKEMQTAEVISRRDMLEILRKLYFRGRHAGQSYKGDDAKSNVRTTLRDTSFDDHGPGARAAPDREENVMEFAKRAASEYVGARLGTIDEEYRTAQRAASEYVGARLGTIDEEYRTAQREDEPEKVKIVKTVENDYDDFGRVAKSTETTRTIYGR